jgi:hypothetical protein
VEIAIAVLIAAVGIGIAMSRLTKVRKEFPELAEKAEKPKRMTKRQKRLEQIRAAEPEYVPPSIDDLIAEEIADLGIARVAGADDLSPAVALKVYRRDTPDMETCPPEDRRFVVAEGVDAATASVDDVRLVCDEHPVSGPDPSAPRTAGDDGR